MPRPYGKYAGGVAAYGAASRYAPGTTTAGTMAVGAYAGSQIAGEMRGMLRGVSRAGIAGSGIGVQRATAKGATGMRKGIAAARGAIPARIGGRAIPRGRIGGGIAGAAAGYAMSRVTRALFGKSDNRSTSMRSNYGYR
jgi:hypothetical protein